MDEDTTISIVFLIHSIHMQMPSKQIWSRPYWYRRPLFILSLSGLICLAAGSELAGPASMASALHSPRQEDQSFDLQADCGSNGDIVMYASWPSNPATLQNQSLELTVYKTGFNQNFYIRVFPISSKGNHTRASNPAEFQSAYDTYLNVQVSDPRVDPTTGKVMVKVSGLSAGKNYFVRLSRNNQGNWTPIKRGRVFTPACPNDDKLK